MFNGLYQPILAQKNNSQILWYDTPAKNWNEALPLGNGKLGSWFLVIPIQNAYN